ncbi:isoform 3 of mrna-capping enzyme [Acrodontium crateriforme]|uniref:Isoform 3 of mrna-capping enzyme n=1 Tax=Acrodontium crateriforme TaxID=150365 RepID=A0AAQ3M457_9PEZI|nr:isoform 3 of mrna-capping enzyme [Acrodontium crateriforme]
MDKAIEPVRGLLSSKWTTSSILGAVLTLIAIRSARDRFWKPSSKTDSLDPGLFKKHSTFESFSTHSGHVYPRIRVFYHAHAQAAKLPKDLPLLVFMHGLGGNATQFSPLLTSMVNVGPCLAIDLPGCGLSDFKPDDAAAYSTGAFAELLFSAIEKYRDVENDQKVILIGHSMGASICALLASSTSPLSHLVSKTIVGFVALCPRSDIPTPEETAMVERLKWMPSRLFDLLRMIDRRGGTQSASVTRVVGKGASEETRKLQIRYNQQSRSATFLRMIINALPANKNKTDNAHIGWPGKAVWSGIRLPLFLVAGESDQLTPPKEIEQIARWLAPDGHAAGHIQRPNHTYSVPSTSEDSDGTGDQTSKGNAASFPKNGDMETIKEVQHRTLHPFALKTTVFPAPAAHGLIYVTATVRILSGLLESFFSHHIDERLSLGWQMQHLTTSGKWDVKNLKKWQSIDRCSEPIGGVFRAMKTMREVDDVHCPREFVKHFSSNVMPDGVAMVVDISHESPVYDPKGLEAGGVEYHKLPTVSKLPPTADEVEHFTSLINQLRRSPKITDKTPDDPTQPHPTIGVHCHYGFNRTGFFIVCYLVERLGYRLQDAIDEFAEKRAPGIKHEHFVNELYVRYAVKMERRGTIVG